MHSEQDVKQIVEEMVEKILRESLSNSPERPSIENSDIEYPELIQTDLRDEMLVPAPRNFELLKKMKKSTPARVGAYRAGARYKTDALLRFRTDHAAAMDAVFSSVSEDFLDKMGLTAVNTKCRDKDDYLTRPDLGRQFDEASIDQIKKIAGSSPQVLIYVSDGLSSTAIEANVADTLPVIVNGLKNSGITVGNPFFVKYGRVPAMDPVSEATGAEVCCVLIGERPGLATAESMSAYMAYKATVNMPEARRNVISNIHSQGTPAVEAGAYIVDLIKLMLKNKASGLDLKL